MQTGIDIQYQFRLIIGVVGIRNPELVAIENRDIARYQFAVVIDFAIVIIFVEIGKEIPIDDADGVSFLFERDWLVDILHLVIMRMGLAVRTNQSVNAERSVVGLVAEVTAIGIIFHAFACLLDALVYPVPYSCASDAAISIDHIPILLQITHRVTHGVGIFTSNKGFFFFLFGFGLQHIGRGIAEVVES